LVSYSCSLETISSSFHRIRDNSAFEIRKTHSEGKSAAGGAT
jgi:hypothetical protein